LWYIYKIIKVCFISKETGFEVTFKKNVFSLLFPLVNRFEAFFLTATFLAFSPALATTNIPSQAWNRDINAGGYTDGAPSGGLGAGTYTWNFAGDFYLSRLNIATAPTTWTNNAPYSTDSNCHFYMYQKPSGGATATYLLNAATLGSGQATYYSLYPKSWVNYYGSDFACKAKVTQFTPMIPGDYTRSSYPEGIYEWDLYNPTCTSTDVAIMLTWDNTFGGTNASVTVSGSNTGLVLTRNNGSATSKSQGEFTLATQSSSGISITYESAASVATLQTAFNTAGFLNNTVGNNTIGGIAFKVTLAPGQSVKVPIVVAWDIPLAQPGTGAQWYREYTRTYGRTGLNSFSVANDALNNYTTWEASIDSWQSGILAGPYPDWLKQMLFNELYYYVDGGTLWEAGQYGDTTYDNGPDMFSSLECYIYTFYGTSDVRFYGSWALSQLWPNIDKQEVEQFADSVTLTGSQLLPRPAALGTCAHDFGSLNDVFTAWNDYTYRDSTTWKDLNSKLVLMIYRDWELTGSSDTTFLNYCWPAVQVAMAKVNSQCVSEGVTYYLPISDGIDQTYDNLGLTGETSYCGSLYLAACEAAEQIATAEGNTVLANTYQSWLTLGQADFQNNLWNSAGGYYDIDTGSGSGGVTGVDRIMSDQLCGEWYAKACALPDIVPASQAVSAWTAVFNNNFSKFDTGTHGVVNVMQSTGAIDTSTSQTQEAWVGTTWGVVAGMAQEGMYSQAVSIGNSLYNSIWNLAQAWFRTPEAWTSGLNNIRAAYYMRANSIWAFKHAYDTVSSCGSATCTPIPTVIPSPTPVVNCPGTPTQTPTMTPTSTPTPTATQTPTKTPTYTTTATPSFTFTPTASKTPTNSPTSTASLTPTITATPTSSSTRTASTTPTSSATLTVSSTPTATVTPTPSGTSTPSPTQTSTKSPTSSVTSTLSSTPTLTSTPTTTSTPSKTPTNTSTPSATPTSTTSNTPSASASSTSTASRTQTPTFTASLTATTTPTLTPTSSISSTPTFTATSTATTTTTNSPTGTLSPSNTPTITSTPTDTATSSTTTTPSSTASRTPSSTATPSLTTSFTATETPSDSPTAIRTPTATLTASFTLTLTPSATQTLTASGTPFLTPSFTPTGSTGSSPVSIGAIYPNPVFGNGPINVEIQAPGQSAVNWSVFTTAFRKVAGGSTSLSGNGVIQWNLEDSSGKPVASGLYYLRVQLKAGPDSLMKILKLLVIR
jgi:non-lysosomal glucosylceramidase